MSVFSFTQIPYLAGHLIQRYSLAEDTAAWVELAAAVLCIVLPYLLGSINPAVLISKIFFHEDIRNFGSGNAGTTNKIGRAHV